MRTAERKRTLAVCSSTLEHVICTQFQFQFRRRSSMGIDRVATHSARFGSHREAVLEHHAAAQPGRIRVCRVRQVPAACTWHHRSESIRCERHCAMASRLASLGLATCTRGCSTSSRRSHPVATTCCGLQRLRARRQAQRAQPVQPSHLCTIAGRRERVHRAHGPEHSCDTPLCRCYGVDVL